MVVEENYGASRHVSVNNFDDEGGTAIQNNYDATTQRSSSANRQQSSANRSCFNINTQSTTRTPAPKKDYAKLAPENTGKNNRELMLAVLENIDKFEENFNQKIENLMEYIRCSCSSDRHN